MEILIVDTKTEKVIKLTEDNYDTYSWEEGNYSCDCNRSKYFLGVDQVFYEHCIGSKRFIAFKIDDENKTISHIGDNYPEEVVEKAVNRLKTMIANSI